MKKSILYCSKREGTYWNIYPSIIQVKMCLEKGECNTIVKIKVFEDKGGLYWAWWDNEDQQFMFVYPARFLTEMCFPYGSKAEIEKGNGLILQVNIEEVE